MEKTERTNAQKQNRVRQRISKASIDPDKYEYIPAKEQNDHVKADQYQQVAIYARVSTDNPMQTTSFELHIGAALCKGRFLRSWLCKPCFHLCHLIHMYCLLMC